MKHSNHTNPLISIISSTLIHVHCHSSTPSSSSVTLQLQPRPLSLFNSILVHCHSSTPTSSSVTLQRPPTCSHLTISLITWSFTNHSPNSLEWSSKGPSSTCHSFLLHQSNLSLLYRHLSSTHNLRLIFSIKPFLLSPFATLHILRQCPGQV